jgi:hypothetical protein
MQLLRNTLNEQKNANNEKWSINGLIWNEFFSKINFATWYENIEL